MVGGLRARIEELERRLEGMAKERAKLEQGELNELRERLEKCGGGGEEGKAPNGNILHNGAAQRECQQQQQQPPPPTPAHRGAAIGQQKSGQQRDGGHPGSRQMPNGAEEGMALATNPNAHPKQQQQNGQLAHHHFHQRPVGMRHAGLVCLL
jgi:hypothetical protein